MKPCPECRIYNTNAAVVCHQCGTPFAQERDMWPIIIKTATAILVTVVLVIGFYASHKNSEKTGKPALKPASLELLSSEGFPTISGKMLVEGRIRNISGVDIKKVYAMVAWFDKKGKKVESNTVSIAPSPLSNRHDASFRVVMSKNQDMESYEISFLDGTGNILRVIDNR